MMPAPSTTTTGPGVPLCTPIDIFNAGTGVGIGDPPAIVVIVYCCAETGIAVRRQKRRVRMGPVISQKAACLKGTCERRLPRTTEDLPDQETRSPGLNLYQVLRSFPEPLFFHPASSTRARSPSLGERNRSLR